MPKQLTIVPERFIFQAGVDAEGRATTERKSLFELIEDIEVVDESYMSDVYPFKGLRSGGFPSGVYFGDCSGGKYTKIPQLRVCGLGIAAFIDEQLVFKVKTNLPGDVQTVPRGELFALWYVVLNACPSASITYITDSFINYDLFYDKERCVDSLNADLFRLLFSTAASKKLDLTVKWMPSHMLTDPKKIGEKASLGDALSLAWQRCCR